MVATWLLCQDVNSLGLNSSFEGDVTSSQNAITRKAGGRKEAEKEIQVHDRILFCKLLLHCCNVDALKPCFFSDYRGHARIHE